jgi:hypothetical protein
MTTLTAAVLIGLTLYAVFCLIRPTKDCRRCSGWGSKPRRGRRAQRRQCRRCDGTGKRFRVPARLVYAVRGAMRRHGQLTARAVARTEDQEQVRS